MAKIKLTKVSFNGTKEQEEKLIAKLDSLKGKPGAMMPALQSAQEIYGYLPIEVQKIISEKLDVTMEEIFGVITFYSQFALNPKGKYKIAICMGTACYVKGSGDILESFEKKLKIGSGDMTDDGKFSLDATRCIGCCGLAPVITVNEDVYGKLELRDIDGILVKYN